MCLDCIFLFWMGKIHAEFSSASFFTVPGYPRSDLRLYRQLVLHRWRLGPVRGGFGIDNDHNTVHLSLFPHHLSPARAMDLHCKFVSPLVSCRASRDEILQTVVWQCTHRLESTKACRVWTTLSLVWSSAQKPAKFGLLCLWFRAQELRESRGGRPGLPAPNSPYGPFGRKPTLEEEELLWSVIICSERNYGDFF